MVNEYIQVSRRRPCEMGLNNGKAEKGLGKRESLKQVDSSVCRLRGAGSGGPGLRVKERSKSRLPTVGGREDLSNYHDLVKYVIGASPHRDM